MSRFSQSAVRTLPRSITLLAILSAPLLFCTPARAQTLANWSLDGTLPSPLAEAGLVTLGNDLFVFGGRHTGGDENTSAQSFLYHPGGAITPKAPLPDPRHEMAFTVHNGNVFSLGGSYYPGGVWGRRADVWSYNPAQNTWHTEPSLTFERGDSPAAASLGQYVYIIGGHSETELHALSTVERYNPSASDGWQPVASMHHPRRQLAATTVNDKIYAIGGLYHPAFSDYHAIEGWLEIYDPATNTWTDAPAMPTPRSNFALATIGTRIYTIGGTTPIGPTSGVDLPMAISDAVEYFDTISGTWHQDRSLPIPLVGPRAAAIGDHLYVLGGVTTSDHYLNTVYTAALPEPSSLLLLTLLGITLLPRRLK